MLWCFVFLGFHVVLDLILALEFMEWENEFYFFYQTIVCFHFCFYLLWLGLIIVAKIMSWEQTFFLQDFYCRMGWKYKENSLFHGILAFLYVDLGQTKQFRGAQKLYSKTNPNKRGKDGIVPEAGDCMSGKSRFFSYLCHIVCVLLCRLLIYLCLSLSMPTKWGANATLSVL